MVLVVGAVWVSLLLFGVVEIGEMGWTGGCEGFTTSSTLEARARVEGWKGMKVVLSGKRKSDAEGRSHGSCIRRPTAVC